MDDQEMEFQSEDARIAIASARNAGKQAYGRGWSMDDNPHGQKSMLRKHWWDGYLDAQYPDSKYDFPKSPKEKPRKTSRVAP